MGRYENPEVLKRENQLRFRAPITVVANPEQLELLRASDASHLIEEANLVSLSPHEKITESHLRGAGILVMQVDPSDPRSMQRIQQVRTLRPELVKIVALESADLSLVRTLLREGVADVVGLPFAPDEILQAAMTALEAQDASNTNAVELAPLIAVTRSLGGTGATTLITHLAAALCQEGAKVCLLDLDIQFGRVAEVLGLQPRRTLADLLEASARADQAYLDSVAAHHSSGLAVISAPEAILPLESIDSEQLLKIIEIARHEYDYVFMDMPSNLTNWSLTVLAKADSIVMLTEQNIASLRQAKRRLDLFRSVDIESRNISIVVNRVERRLFGSISLGDVEDALGLNVVQGLHSEGQHIATAQEQGLLLGQMRSKSAYVADVAKLADALTHKVTHGSHE